MVLPLPPDLTTLSHAEKDALIVALWEQVGALMARVAMLEAKLNELPKTSDNSSVPPSKGQKANRDGQTKREGSHQGGADLFAGIRSVAGIDAYTAIQNTLAGNTALKPG